MFGDIVIRIKQLWKEFWCIHDYQWTGKLDVRYMRCAKCGRIKK